jgi:hypothetical protein
MRYCLRTGVIQSVSLPFSNSGATGSRTEIRATISQTITQSSGVVPCNLQVTLETYDTNTGVTHVFLANVAAFPATVVGSFPFPLTNR